MFIPCRLLSILSININKLSSHAFILITCRRDSDQESNFSAAYFAYAIAFVSSTLWCLKRVRGNHCKQPLIHRVVLPSVAHKEMAVLADSALTWRPSWRYFVDLKCCNLMAAYFEGFVVEDFSVLPCFVTWLNCVTKPGYLWHSYLSYAMMIVAVVAALIFRY